jgi:hypothetical protein
MGNSLAAVPRKVLLRGRLNARVGTVRNDCDCYETSSKSSSLTRIELRAELRVLEHQVAKCKGKAD